MNDVLKGEMSVEHTHPKLSSRATVDVEGSWLKTSSVFAIAPRLLVGGETNFDLAGAKETAVKAYSVGASTGGARWGASLTCTNKMQTYNASGYYIIQPTMVGSVLASCTPEKSENS